MLTTSINELKELNSTLRDEHTALHLLHCSLEEKLRKTQTENTQLVERLMKFKAKDAEKMNEENETFLRYDDPFPTDPPVAPIDKCLCPLLTLLKYCPWLLTNSDLYF